MNENMLRAEFMRLPPLPNDWRENLWNRHRHSIRNHVENDSIPDFLRWSTVLGSLFVGDNSFVEYQLNELMNRGDWEYYRKALTFKQNVGNPAFYVGGTTNNFINQCYHLSKLEDATGKRIADFDTVVEFGGGYGSMVVICTALGFTGEYYIYDLPELSLLQEYYLSQYDINAFLLNVNDDDTFVAPPMDTDVLFGLYSLSEVNRSLRETFISATRAKNILIASQQLYEGVLLPEELSGMVERLSENKWSLQENKLIDGHFYLIGKRR